MSRFLIASWDGGGNATPAFHLGSRLVRRGHHVRMLGWAPMAERAAAAGLDFAPYATTPAWPEDLVFEDDWVRLEECLQGAACRADVVAAARQFGADVLVIDCMLRAGLDAARDLGVPTAALMHVSYQQFLHVWGDRAMGTDVRAMLADCDVILNLQPPGFDAPCPLPPGHEYVGPIVSPDTTRTLDTILASTLAERGDPWVLLSLSTTSQPGQRETLQAILDRVATLPVRVLVTLGGSTTADQLDPPSNCTVSGFVPHELVLPHMSAVVTHAGMSTITMALAAGIPMVCIPQGRDQGGNAERVAAVGAGLIAEPAAVAAAIRTVLADPRHHDAARRMARASAPFGGGGYAADLVETLAVSSAVGVRQGSARCTEARRDGRDVQGVHG